MHTHKTISVLLLFPAFYLISCNGNGQQGALTEGQGQAKQKIDSLQKVASQTARSYKDMDNPTLFNKLMEQSKQKKEPFNSLAYRELQTRTNVDPEALSALIRDSKNADALLPLLLLRKLNNAAYLRLPMQLRIGTLTDALNKSKYFNTWGIPPFYLQDASRAMLELDTTAFPALRRMLADTRPAPVFGSKEYMIYQRYQYRLCDYALFFLKNLQGNRNFAMPPTPAGRDSLISTLRY